VMQILQGTRGTWGPSPVASRSASSRTSAASSSTMRVKDPRRGPPLRRSAARSCPHGPIRCCDHTRLQLLQPALLRPRGSCAATPHDQPSSARLARRSPAAPSLVRTHPGRPDQVRVRRRPNVSARRPSGHPTALPLSGTSTGPTLARCCLARAIVVEGSLGLRDM